MSETTVALVPFEQLPLTTDQQLQLKNLMGEVQMLEAIRGKNALELGNKLRQIRTLLGNVPAPGGQSAWGMWCDAFVYTRDYAARMIQIAEVFENVNGTENLSIRHMREIARISDGTTSVQALTGIVNEHQLGVHEVRHMVTAANAGTLNVDDLIANNPDLKAELDRRVKEAKRESREKNDQLQAKLRELDADKDVAVQQATVAEERALSLQKELKVEKASLQFGEGDPEKGKLIIKLEQTEQAKENAELALEQTQKTLRKLQADHDRWVNSPSGQAKIDFRRLMEDLNKVFKDAMAPAYLAMRVNRVATPEAHAEAVKLVEVVEQWASGMRDALGEGPALLTAATTTVTVEGSAA